MQSRKPESVRPQEFINPHHLFYGVWLPHWLERRAEVSEKAKKLYAHLTYFAGDKGYAWPTLNTLAEKLHVSRRHVIRLVRELSDHRLLSVTNITRPGKGNCANHYRFLWHPWMEDEHGRSVRPRLDDKSFKKCDSPGASSALTPRDNHVTPSGDINVTPGVTSMSPKENHKKRLIKKHPKGAFDNPVALQVSAISHHSRSPVVRSSPQKDDAQSCSVIESAGPPRSKDIQYPENKSRAALQRKGWSIARRLLGEFWENCKIKPNLGILSAYAVRSLQSGFQEADIISAFERALHQCHGHATDTGKIWEPSSTVYRAEAMLKSCPKRRRSLMADERSELQKCMELSLRSRFEKKPNGSPPHSDRLPNSPRKKEVGMIPPQQWLSPKEIRATFNAFRQAAGLPTRPDIDG